MSDFQSTSNSGISPEAADAIAAICLMAAFADGQKGELEQQQLKDVFDSLGSLKTAALYQRVMLGGTTLAEEARDLATPELRRLAFELALSVCDADGATNEAEATFLNELRSALEIPDDEATTAREEADRLATLPADVPLETDSSPDATALDTKNFASASPSVPAEDTRERELDGLILNAAILNGGLELLPQALATVAIMPLQLRMVYQIGQAYGYSLGREHLREFVAIAGVGMTSQAVEGQLRKVFGGLAKKAAGKGAKRLVSSATGATLTFATTYALGQAAKRYYAGGRSLSMSEVRAVFREQLGKGQSLFETYRGDVQDRSRNINLQNLLKMVR